MTLAIHHLAVTAADPDQLARLYTDGAGFAPVDGADGWVAAPNAFLALYPATGLVTERQRTRRVCDPGLTHFCVQSGDGEAMWQKLADAGLRFNARPVALGTGATYAYGHDPECGVIEAESVGDAPPDAAPWFAHVALCTPDLERLVAFYEKLVGRAAHHRGTYQNPLFEQITGLPDIHVSAAWIMTDNLILEIWQYLNPPTLAQPPTRADEPGYRHIGFVAGDLEAEGLRLADLGTRLDQVAPVQGLAARAGVDPDGNRFLILEAPPAGHPLALDDLSDPGAVTRRHQHLLGD